MHILIIPSWYPTKNNSLSGIFFKEQAEALSKEKNMQVGCITINESSPRYIFNDNKCFDFFNQNINGVDTISLLYPISNRMKRLRELVRLNVFKILFKKYIHNYGKPDLIHLHSFMHGNMAIWLKNEFKIPYVVTEHSSGFAREIYNKSELKYAENIFLNSSYNLSVSGEFANLLKKKFNILFDYVPNSIDTSFFTLKNSLQSTKKFNFVNIAFLNENKNQKLLIKAFDKAFKENLDVNLTIIGDGPEYLSLSNLIKNLKLENQVKLYGRANRDEIRNLLHDSDAFVLSSKYETFGVVLIEAMSCGLPVVSTKCGGPESIVTSEELGVLVQNDDIDALMNGMMKIYHGSYDKDIIRQHIVDEFSSYSISKKLIKIYGDLIEKSNINSTK